METTPLQRNKSVPISSRSHLNLTLNIYHCGNHDLLRENRFPYFEPNTFCFLMVNEGTVRLKGDSHSALLSRGQGMVAFPMEKAELINDADSPANVTWVSFGGYLVDVYLSRANLYPCRPVVEDRQGELLGLLNRLYERSLQMPNRYCKMMALLYDIFSCLLDENPTRPGLNGGFNSMYYVVRAIDRIENGGFRDVSVEELASSLGVTRKHMSAAFFQVMGVTTKKYIILYRIEQACRLLRDTLQPVSEISELVGYADQFHFAKEFKRITGVTPTEYRLGQSGASSPECTKLKEALINQLSGRGSVFTG